MEGTFLLSNPSTGPIQSMGPYCCDSIKAGLIGRGSYGSVIAGWGPKGSAVAITHFRIQEKRFLRKHYKVMNLVKKHVGVAR